MFGKKKATVWINEAEIDDILSRSVGAVLPSKDALKKELMSGRRLRVYAGADATGPELHLGHANNFILLEKLRKLGHEVIILFGDFTGMVGDPSGKDAARRQLTKAQVDEHIKGWKKQIGKIISFTDKRNPALIRKNSAWLSKLTFDKIIGIASQFTVQQMIERDMFERRLKGGKPICLHEFLYPLMQGYDSVAMDVDIEVGGSDQTFNMLAGRTLQRKFHAKEKFVIATTLLENPKTGKKLMSKSEGAYIALSDSPRDMFGKTMALPDEVMIQLFTDSTHVSLSEIEVIKKELDEGVNPRDIKLRLAETVAETYHGKKEAERAREQFVHTFSKKEVPEDIGEVTVSKDTALFEAVKEQVASKGEWRRLIGEGAVSEIGGEKITDSNTLVERDMTLRIGKKRFLKIHIKDSP